MEWLELRTFLLVLSFLLFFSFFFLFNFFFFSLFFCLLEKTSKIKQAREAQGGSFSSGAFASDGRPGATNVAVGVRGSSHPSWALPNSTVAWAGSGGREGHSLTTHDSGS